MDTTTTTTEADASAIKILMNGIKEPDGTYTKAWYSIGRYRNLPEGTITVYASEHCGRFGKRVRQMFDVQNDTDAMTDYFESDSFRVFLDHPLYSEFLKQINRLEESRQKKEIKRKMKRARVIEESDTVVIDGRRWKVLKKTPQERLGIVGVSYELSKLFLPKKTYHAWQSLDGKRYTTPYCV